MPDHHPVVDEAVAAPTMPSIPAILSLQDYQNLGQLHAIQTCFNNLVYGIPGQPRTKVQRACAGLERFCSLDFSSADFKYEQATKQAVKDLLFQVLVLMGYLDDESNYTLMFDETLRNLVSDYQGDSKQISKIRSLLDLADSGKAFSIVPMPLASAIADYLASLWGGTQEGEERFSHTGEMELALDSQLREAQFSCKLSAHTMQVLRMFNRMQWCYGHVE